MRILAINPPTDFAAPGGIETYARELMAGMALRGHEIDTINTDPGRILPAVRLTDRLPSLRFRQRFYFWRRSYVQDFRYHAALNRIARDRIRRFRPDVIHALHLYPFGAVADVRLPYIVTAHGLEVDRIPPVLGSIGRARSVHCVSNYTAGLVRTAVPDAPTTVLSWGVRSQETTRTERADFDLISVCRLVRRKNVDTVLRALQTMPHLRYAIVGDGPDAAALRQLASELGLTGITFFGAVSDEARNRVMASSRVMIMCPRQEPGDVEGLGLVYYEALSAGLPLVAASTGGAPEAVGRAGLLVSDPDNVEEVAGCIRRALDAGTHAALLAEVRTAQRERSWSRFLDDFEELYESARRS